MSFRMLVIDVDGHKINLPWSRDEPPSPDEEDAIKELIRADLKAAVTVKYDHSIGRWIKPGVTLAEVPAPDVLANTGSFPPAFTAEELAYVARNLQNEDSSSESHRLHDAITQKIKGWRPAS
jgi:hypothetical protein